MSYTYHKLLYTSLVGSHFDHNRASVFNQFKRKLETYPVSEWMLREFLSYFQRFHCFLESPLWFTFWFSLIFKELWLVNVFFWLIHQSLISWFYYLIEYSGVWSVINHIATYQYWETLTFTLFCNLCEAIYYLQKLVIF